MTKGKIVEKRNHKFIHSYTLFTLVFLFHLIWIFQGIDVTDWGNQLTSQTRPFRHNGDLCNMHGLSNIFGGMWLKIIGSPSIIWAKLGGILLFSLNAILSYKILSVYFDKKRVFFTVFASTLFITMNIPNLIHYFNFPALLLSCLLWVINQLLNETSKSIRFKGYSFLCGFLTIPIILARFPLVLIVFMPVPIFLYYLVTKKDYTGVTKIVSYATSGIIASLFCFALLYRVTGFLSIYIESIKTQMVAAIIGNNNVVVGSDSHGIATQLKVNAGLVYHTFICTFIASIGLYIVSLFKDRLGNSIGHLIITIAIVLGSGILLIMWGFYRYTGQFIHLWIGLTLLVTVIFLLHDRGNSRNLTLLLLASNFVMIVTPLGSNTGIRKAIYGMWVILPLTFLLAYELRDKTENKRLSSMLSLSTSIISLTVLISLFMHFSNNYRDHPNRFQLNTAFEHKSLRYIHSQKERVKVVDEALAQIDNLVDENDAVLMVNSIPLFYYLTKTKPFFGPSWLVQEPLAKIKEMQNSATDHKNYPKLFVYSKVDPRCSGWPNDEVSSLTKKDLPKVEYLKDQYINKLNYNLVWENDAFGVYSNPF